MTRLARQGDGRHRGGRRRRRRSATGRCRVRAAGRRPHRRRVLGDRPDPRSGQGMGDPDLRHRRQAGPGRARARGHRRDRGGRGDRRDRVRRPIGSAAIVAAGVAGCAAVLSRGGATVVDVVPTRGRAPRAGSPCCACWSRADSATPTSTEPDAPTPDRGRRLSLVTLGLPRRRRGQRRGGRRDLPADIVGVGRPSGVRAAARRRRPLARCLRSVQPKGVALPSFVTSNDRLLPHRHRAERAAS